MAGAGLGGAGQDGSERSSWEKAGLGERRGAHLAQGLTADTGKATRYPAVRAGSPGVA